MAPITEEGGASAAIFRSKHSGLLICLFLAVITCAVYAPVHRYPFVDIDDGLYVYDNPHVTGPLNWVELEWAFTHSYGANYAPLDLIGHHLNVDLFGLNAGCHHDVNVGLHVLSVLLLFWVLRQATGYTGRSLMVAALFALHPINVENVAWVAEQKTMLSTIFFLLALGAYRWYALEPQSSRMTLVGALYGVGLLVKPQVITFPLVLLLWDWWPLGRIWQRTGQVPGVRIENAIPARTFSALLLEKVPLFLLAFAGAALTMHAERFMQTVLVLPLTIRLGNAVLSYVRYIGKAFWPANLALMYLHPGYALPWVQVWLSLIVLIVITAFVATKWEHRYLPVGWLWFVGTMIPTIGLVQVDLHALADRYAYIAFIGLFIMVCWGASEWAEARHLFRPALPAASLCVLLVLSVLAHRQVGFWSDKFTLWTHTLQVTHRNWAADFRLGQAYDAQGQDDKALGFYYEAAKDVPRERHVNLQIALLEHKRGNLKQAIEYYKKVLADSSDPDTNAQVLANMGHAYGDLGSYDKARECFREANLRPIHCPSDLLD